MFTSLLSYFVRCCNSKNKKQKKKKNQTNLQPNRKLIYEYCDMVPVYFNGQILEANDFGMRAVNYAALVVFTKYFLKHNFKLSFQTLRSRFIFVSSSFYFIYLHNFSLQYYLPKLRELIFREKIFKIFFSFSRELIFAKKPTSHIS